MPRYDYRCSACGGTFEADFKIADRDIPVNDSCPLCEAPCGTNSDGVFIGTIERYLPRTNGLNYSAADKKPPEAFKDMLRNMKSKHRHSTINV